MVGRRVDGPASARVTIDGREYINFFGSGYLALARLPEMRAAALRALERGTAFAQQFPSSLETFDPHFAHVERAAAAACATEASVYFASGYLIGMVGLASLEGEFDVIVLDEYAHYNLKDAAQLLGLPCFTFTHCDASALADLLKREAQGKGRRPVVITDGVFATTGRLPPLADYAAILVPYGGRLFVDESHAFGVVGEFGRGAAEYCGVEEVASTGATLSKAYCAQGAIVGCSSSVAARLRNVPPLRGACAGSPVSAAVAAAALTCVARRPSLRTDLRALTDYLRTRLRALGLAIQDSPAPIVAFKWGGRKEMLALQRRAFEDGVYLYHSTYIGTDADGVIRCAVFCDHTKEDIDALVDILK
jgi:7-keto-8-aminopelargonate synthetase-like enzyme